MSNSEIATIFDELADMEEIEGNRWESLAYRKAAASIRSLGVPLETVYSKGELRTIDGVGSAIEKKIIQFLETGNVEKYAEMKSRYPIDFTGLRRVQGLGPKKIYALYTGLGITSIEDLRSAIESHKIEKLPGFGKKSEDNIKHSLDLIATRSVDRLPIGKIYYEVQDMVKALRKSGAIQKVEVVGSIRRMKETVGDVDILAVSDSPEEALRTFLSQKYVTGVIASGPAKTSVNLSIGLNGDFRVFSAESFGSAMQYFTGSKEHNIKMRDLAIQNGLKLNEYGLFKKDIPIAGKDEEGIYSALGLQFIPPELRENTGEIDAARDRILPHIPEYGDIVGDMHITVSRFTPEIIDEIVAASRSEGMKYAAILYDSTAASGGSDAWYEEYRLMLEYVEKLNAESDFRVIPGIKIPVNPGIEPASIPRDILNSAYVVGTLPFNGIPGVSDLTDTVLESIKSRSFRTLSLSFKEAVPDHGTGMDNELIFRVCAESGVFIELSGNPYDYGIHYMAARAASSSGVKFVLGSRASSPDDVRYIRFSTAIARRAWVEKSSIINSAGYGSVIEALQL
ncbi:MAG: helix-hairpin-helix domain-containing protein [Thermoplasmataceae archaeon]